MQIKSLIFLVFPITTKNICCAFISVSNRNYILPFSITQTVALLPNAKLSAKILTCQNADEGRANISSIQLTRQQ